MTDSTLQAAIEQFAESEDSCSMVRSDYEEDVRFGRLGDQWPQDIKADRQKEGRPCLTINRQPSFVRQVVNEGRQNRPSIHIRPVEGSDRPAADVIQGLVRFIERRSNADNAYDTALDHSTSGGFGFFYIDIEYADNMSFDLECVIKRVPNPLMVHWDPDSTEFDGRDWDYAFVSEWMDEDKFKAKYPDASPIDFESGSGNDLLKNWVDDDQVRLAIHWERSNRQQQLIEFVDEAGNVRLLRDDQLPNIARTAAREFERPTDGMSDDDLSQTYINFAGLTEQRRRNTEAWDVKRRLLSGADVLEESDWPGQTIPVIPVWGEEVIIDGERYLRSLIRDAKDPQMMFNFWRSASTELVALAPKAPYIGPKGFVPESERDKWETANTRSHPYMEYDAAAVAAAGGNAPRREPFAGVPAGALQESLNAADDMKATTGIYDAGLGAQGNETSGRAILARQNQGDVSNFHFLDNLRKGIRRAGEVLVEIIPSVYGARDAITILGEDDVEKVVNLTQRYGGATQGTMDDPNDPQLYNLQVGRYDVDVKAGPSYATRREETREVLIEVIRQIPGAAAVLGDVLIEHLDISNSEKIADRLRGLLPPQIQAQEGITPSPTPGTSPVGANATGTSGPQVVNMPNRGAPVP